MLIVQILEKTESSFECFSGGIPVESELIPDLLNDTILIECFVSALFQSHNKSFA